MWSIIDTGIGVEIHGTIVGLSNLMAALLEAADPGGDGSASRVADLSRLPENAMGRIRVERTEGPILARIKGNTLSISGGNEQLLDFAGAFNVRGRELGTIATFAWVPGATTMSERSLPVTIKLIDYAEPPTSATVVGWLLVVLGGFAMFGTAMAISMFDDNVYRREAAKSFVPLPVQGGMLVLTTAIYLVCGYALLNRYAWSQRVFATWVAIGTLFGLTTSGSPAQLLMAGIGSIVPIVLAFQVYRPEITVWLGTKPPKS
ncbi:MAG: hypothetical protein GC159_00670 [Phycisphaera sp.]|nr:hypothetical protein [Phycisphaera sp.]